ncbi:MAG: hypothetical protein GY854_06475 [Deltaproteobacteria bacterium]|nr:hypothetical protein [Deltaproteobacteria bacterium]
MEGWLKILQALPLLSKLEHFTLIIAGYGAVVATAALAISVWTALRDRSGIRIDATRNIERWVPCPTRADVINGQTSMGLRKFVRVSVMNRGRRPVTIAKVFLNGKTKRQVQKYQFPDVPTGSEQELGEGKSLVVEARHESIGLSHVSRVVVEDAVGRTWGRRLNWRELSPKIPRIETERSEPEK